MNQEPLRLRRRTFLKGVGAVILAPAVLISGEEEQLPELPIGQWPKTLTGLSYIDTRLTGRSSKYRRTEDRFFMKGLLRSCKHKNLTPVNIQTEDLGRREENREGKSYKAFCTLITLNCVEGDWDGKGFIPIYLKGKGSTIDDISL